MPALAAAIALVASLQPYDLRCEARVAPQELQSGSPHLSWKLRPVAPSAKNLRQSAYRIVVATSPSALEAKKPDLWDSGKVEASDTFGIAYAGRKLGSRAWCYWRVQVWDQAGAASWSPTATFATGLLSKADWTAEWIHGPKPERPQDNLERANWIWVDPKAATSAKAGNHTFVKEFEAGDLQAASMLITADNTFVLKVNGKEVRRTTDPENWRAVQSIDLLPHLAYGHNVIEVDANNATDSPAGLIASIELHHKMGRKRVIVTDDSWRADILPAAVLGRNGIAPWGKVSASRFVVSPALYFRKAVKVGKPVTRATAYVTALGIVDFTIDGQRVDEAYFTPGWSDYRKRVYYRAYDVTGRLKKGLRNLGAVLGQGWYAGYVAWGAQREHYGDTPMLKAQVEVEYADGSRETFRSDSTWQVSTGPILDEHFLHGEKFDARVQPKDWAPVTVGKSTVGIEAFPGDPVEAYATLKPVKAWAIAGGKYLIDFGQNLSGFVKLKLNEPAGTKIVIRHGERLDQDGSLYTTNLRLAQAIDAYTCNGKGVEEWHPRFTFHGFQYVEVSGLSHAPRPGEFEAIAISSATPEVGKLETSDPMLNKLARNAWWTQKMNFVDVPTDCPQRDERLGWTGDAQAYIRTATYFSDVQAFFTKWLVALDDSQRPDGEFPMVAPVLKTLEDGGPAWADAGVICPMTIYDAYGDKALLARHYPAMKRFIEFTRKRSTPEMLPPKEFHCFGDWLNIAADTPNDVIYTAYFAGSTALVARAAHALGKADDERDLLALHAKIRAAFQRAYVDANGRVKGDTQCGYVLALGFGLLDERQAKLAANHLIRDIEKRDWHLSTGFVGTRDLMHVLSAIGRDDIAFRLLHNKTFPSWGFTIEHGATSIWERWDGWTPENGFQDPGMNSFAHYAYGAVAGWMFKTIGGISELEPGYGKILIAPKLDPNLQWSKCSYESVRGPIRVEWKRSGGKVEYDVEIPVNATAKLELPQPGGRTKSRTVGSGRWQF